MTNHNSQNGANGNGNEDALDFSELTFEQALERLDETVQALEIGRAFA